MRRILAFALPTHCPRPISLSSSRHLTLRLVDRCLVSVLLLSCGLIASSASAQRWTNLTPTSGPAPHVRAYSGAVYDPVAHRVVITTGAYGNAMYFDDVWSFDLTTRTWTDVTPPTGPKPGGRRVPNCVYDPVEHRMLMWQGRSDVWWYNDVWAFDLTTNTWSELSVPGVKPQPRYGAASAWDPSREELVTFSGFTSVGRMRDTWRFDPSANVWINETYPTGGPILRCLHNMVYDSTAHRMLMYGGQTIGMNGDLWELDLVDYTWTDLTTFVRPDDRSLVASVYDPILDRFVMFGGQLDDASYVDEMWEFDLSSSTWSTMTADGTWPSPRAAMATVYLEGQDRMVFFGGRPFNNEVWSLQGIALGVTAAEPTLPGRVFAGEVAVAPNPFNPATEVRFRLAHDADVTVEIFDAAGRRVRTLELGQRSVGLVRQSWDGRTDSGAPAASGSYLVRVRAGDDSLESKLTLLR